MAMKPYERQHRHIIRHVRAKLWWSNEMGWVDRRSATRFTTKERNTLNLPIDGKWVHA